MAAQNPQTSSLFFRKLPPEIRLEVYSHLFHSTRLSFGKFESSQVRGKSDVIRLRPAPNSLSLLRVCSRFRDEVGHSWQGQVLFSFEDVKTMLDKLTSLDPQVLGRLRHMRYTERRWQQEFPAQSTWRHEHQYSLSRILKLLPGLCLDRLTVLGHSSRMLRYYELDDLINHSDGWKELYYLSWNSQMLGFLKHYNKSQSTSFEAPQPLTWSQALTRRDGPTASVTIYRSTSAAKNGSILSRPETGQVYATPIAEPGKIYEVKGTAGLMGWRQKKKEMLVVARRGEGIDYAEKLGSPLLRHDIRERWPGMTWAQFRGDDRFEYPPDNTGLAPGTQVDELGIPIMAHIYRTIDDYEWSRSHSYHGRRQN